MKDTAMDTETLRGLVAAELFVEIAHGDAEHRAWLYDALLKSPTIEALLERVRVLEGENLSGIWEQARSNHATYSATGSGEDDLRFLTLGLVGEAGELANFIKKRWRDGDLHEEDCRKETADVMAYLMMVAQCLGMTPADLVRTVAEKQAVFVAKMQSRAALSKEPRT